jgi:hypothetical protein
MRHIVIWFYNIFPHYLINGMIFGKKKLLNIKCVIWFSLYNFCWSYFSEIWIFSEKFKRNLKEIESSWNVMAHGDVREEKWRGNWRMECVASTLHTTSEHGLSSISTADAHTTLPVVDWTDVSAVLNGLVPFGERRNLVSARVPSHFKKQSTEL